MVIASILLGTSALAAPQELMLLRTRLQNGAVILAERVPDVKRVEIQLWCSARATLDTKKSYGYRHMLEHLIARRDRSIDTELEKEGGFLTAATYRSGTQFSISVPSSKIDIALSSLRKLVQFPMFTQELLNLEAKTLGQEAALKSRSSMEAASHWTKLGGPEALDPAGPDQWEEVPSPSALTAIYKAQMSATQLTLVVIGDETVDQLTDRFKSFLSSMPIYGTPEPTVFPPDINLTTATSGTDSVGIGVGEFADLKTLARIAAALSLIADAKESYFTYTPSGDPAVVTVGSRQGKSEIRKSLRGTEVMQQFGLGKSLLARWVDAQRSSPSKWAELRGLLSSSGADSLLRDLPRLVRQIRWVDFEEAYRLLEGAL